MSGVMQAGVAAADAVTAAPENRGRPRRPARRPGSWVLGLFSAIVLIYLLIPIAYTIVFSFNDYRRTNIVWRGFTLDNWTSVCNAQGVCEAFGNSILIAVVSTLIATTIGTAAAIALARYRFRFKGPTSLLIFLPMATPEVVLGAGLASQFLTAGVPKGIVTVILAHVMFCISFVIVTVRARVAGLDPSIEEAGRDLYGSPAQVFFRITLPLLAPGIAGGALLAFALSFDDFIITNFNSGPVSTFPKFIYTAAARGIPAEANVIASTIFLLAIVAVLVTQLTAAARRKRLTRR
ncbi:MAG: ABC transporter permease [Naasia sp.]